MAACNICGETSTFDYSCRYCDGTFCNKHQLPERHNCVYLGGAKTLGPEFRDFEGAKEVSAHRRSKSETASESVDRREERDTTDCEGCGETIAASRTYCPECRLKQADLNQTQGPDVVVDESLEPDSLGERTRNIDSTGGNPMRRWLTYALLALVVVVSGSIGLLML